MIKKVLMILALITLLINVQLEGKYSGYEAGIQISKKDYADEQIAQGHNYVYRAHPTAYADYAEVYSIIKWLLIAFLIGFSLKKELLSQFICITSLIWTVYEYREIYIHKREIFDILDLQEHRFFDIIRETIPIDWICFSIVIILMAHQIVTMFNYWVYKNEMVK